MHPTPRHAALIALLALGPGVAFAVSRTEVVVAVALVNVLLIAGSLYVALSPVEGEHGHGTETGA